MNKISKKIVALATMAAFVLTLVPAAAFAAPADQTGYTVTKAEATADKYNSTTVNITLSDEDLDAVLADTANNVLVWAEDANDAVVGSYGTVTDATWGGSYNASNTFNGMAVLVPNADDNTFSIEINNVGAVGDYKVYVALNVAPHAQSVADAEKAALVKGGVTFHALGDAVGDASNYGVYEGGVLQAEEDVAVNTDLITTFQINDKNGDATAPALKDVVVWAVNKDNGQVTELASIVDEDGNPVRKTGSTGNNAKSYYLDSVNNGETLTVQFSIAGDYVLYAGVGTSYDAANAAKLGLGRAVTTVRVTDNTEVESMDISAYINGSSTEYEMEFDKDANTYVLDLTDAKANFKFNGIDYVTLSGIALEKDNSPAKNQTINFTANEPNTVVRLNPTSDNTSTDGKFQTVFKMESQKNTVITEQQPERTAAAPVHRRQSVLIVDDSELNRKMLGQMLGSRFDIAEAASGEACLQLLEQNATGISIVLLDIHMPGIDGFTVLEEMNQKNLLEQIPVIMISSEDTVDAVRRAFDLGASDYISRPFDAKVVYQRIINTIQLYAKQRRLSAMAADLAFEKERASRMMIGILSQVVEKRNGESRDHVQRVAQLTSMLLAGLAQKTDRYPLTREMRRTIATAAALHDIGKMEICEDLLHKEGPLTEAERRTLQSHTLLGAQMLEEQPECRDDAFARTAYNICRWHHERYDGGGYPDGLQGEQIPIEAQVVGLADVYERLVSRPVDGHARTHSEVVQMICTGVCGAFNPLLLDCLQDMEAEIARAMQDTPEET